MHQLIKGCACLFMRRKQPKPTWEGQQHSLPGRSSSNEKECEAAEVLVVAVYPDLLYSPCRDSQQLVITLIRRASKQLILILTNFDPNKLLALWGEGPKK